MEKLVFPVQVDRMVKTVKTVSMVNMDKTGNMAKVDLQFYETHQKNHHHRSSVLVPGPLTMAA